MPVQFPAPSKPARHRRAAAAGLLGRIAAPGFVDQHPLRVSRPVAAGAIAAFNDINPMAGNLANMARDLGVPETPCRKPLRWTRTTGLSRPA